MNQQPPPVTIPPLPPHHYLHHTTLHPRPKLILIGDSITEQGSLHNSGWVTSLSIRYNRRLDVLNRGMNGYNSHWGKSALRLILEDVLGREGERSTSCDVDSNGEEPSTTTTTENYTKKKYPQYTFLIGYGANDSCLPSGSCSRHHVPLDAYSANLKDMVQMIQSYPIRCDTATAKSNDCTTTNTEKTIAVGLITPPPVDPSIKHQSRDNTITKMYAEAVMILGKEMNVPVVDLWNGMQLPVRYYGSGGDESNDKNECNATSTAEGDKTNNIDESAKEEEYGTKWKQEYLSDGLHLTQMGNYRMFELVTDMLEKDMGLTVENVPRQYPDHSLVDDEFPERTFC